MVLDGDHLPVRILSRKSLIKRKAAGAETKIQLIAANIDVLFVVTSCNDDFSLNRVERYLTIANVSEIQCVVVLTKTDLCSDAEVFKRQLADAHPEIPVECVNATNNTDLDRLNQWIGKGQTAALLGSSGVGKSTIINGLQTGSDQRTGAIREHDGKGRHTTTSRSLHRLSHGGLLIDTPGMRELQIVDSEQGIRATFHEIDAFAERCRFHNCSHTTEPGCAVLRAVESGDLDPRLLENYQKIMAEQDRNNQSLAERRSSDRALSRFYKTTQKGARKFKSRE
jgi:ribosome biogenesis GTPase